MGYKGLIVGIDQGTTTAVAIVDLKGVFVGMKSKKDFSQSEQQEYIQSFGQPLLIAVDVSKIPALVQKLGASFIVRVEAPQKDLGRLEKSEVVSVFLSNYKGVAAQNFHEVSALAAAVVCYNKHGNKFRQIERQLSELGLVERTEEIKKKVVQGISVNRALEGRP